MIWSSLMRQFHLDEVSQTRPIGRFTYNNAIKINVSLCLCQKSMHLWGWRILFRQESRHSVLSWTQHNFQQTSESIAVLFTFDVRHTVDFLLTKSGGDKLRSTFQRSNFTKQWRRPRGRLRLQFWLRLIASKLISSWLTMRANPTSNFNISVTNPLLF